MAGENVNHLEVQKQEGIEENSHWCLQGGNPGPVAQSAPLPHLRLWPPSLVNTPKRGGGWKGGLVIMIVYCFSTDPSSVPNTYT